MRQGDPAVWEMLFWLRTNIDSYVQFLVEKSSFTENKVRVVFFHPQSHTSVFGTKKLKESEVLAIHMYYRQLILVKIFNFSNTSEISRKW